MDNSPLASGAFVVSPLREQVTNRLRNAIVDGRLRSGQRLTERELIEWTGVSRATVREAIRDLAALELLTVVPGKGAVVALPTMKEAEEIYQVRAMLEGMACRQFAERAVPADVQKLWAAFRTLESASLGTVDPHRFLAAKNGFYEVLFVGAGNSTIPDLLAKLHARITLLRATSISQPDRPRAMLDELRAIILAIEAGDAAEAERACVEHVLKACQVALAALSTSFTEPEVLGVVAHDE